MADDATVDLSTFPDVDVSTELTAGQEDQQDSSIQMISYPFLPAVCWQAMGHDHGGSAES
jgi:hypothetical protein